MSKTSVIEPSPFTPGYGKLPRVFGGHKEELEELTYVIKSLDFGENQSVLVSGLRGAGKTSMLLKLQQVARENRWLVISDDASSGLMNRIMETHIPEFLTSLPAHERKRLTGVGLWQLNAQFEYAGRPRETKPLLRKDLVALQGLLDETGPHRGILITIDEVASGKARLRDLSRLAREVDHAIKEGANVMIVFAGIRIDLDALVDEDHTTFLRRSRELDFRRLTPSETRRVLEETIHIGGKRVDEEALDLLVRFSQGYPYLVQLAGDFAWRSSGADSTIRLKDAEYAHGRAVTAVEQRVVSRAFHDLSEKDREFVAAMAVDTGRSKMADVVERMGVTPQYAQTYKKRLIDSGYVQSDGHGYVTFSLPYLGDYVRSLENGNLAPISTDPWAELPPPERPRA